MGHVAHGHSYFLRREVWELLLRLLGAGTAWARAESLGAGLSSLAGGEHREGRGPSRACMTLMAPTVRMSPQSKVGASRGDSCLRNQWRARARVLLALRVRGGLLSCGRRIEEGPWGGHLPTPTFLSLANAFLPGGQTA